LVLEYYPYLPHFLNICANILQYNKKTNKEMSNIILNSKIDHTNKNQSTKFITHAFAVPVNVNVTLTV